MEENKLDKEILEISISPHIHSTQDVNSIMRDVLIALAIPLIASVYFFGFQALKVVIVCVIFTVSSEAIFQKLFNKPIRITDGSAIITGVLLAFCLPPTSPVWLAALGAIFSIIIAKEIFGGLGYNSFNPALVGRAILLASWPVQMTNWINPLRYIGTHIDTVSSATPLAAAKMGLLVPGYWDLFIGQVGGSLGETSALALLLGAAYLFYRKIISWHIPFSYIGTVAILSAILGKDPFFHILAGGLFLGAFFMATDYVTSPITNKGKIIFGIGCGIMTVLIRLYGGFPEGVCYSILFMNALVPLIDKFTQPKAFGVLKNATNT